MGKCKTKAIQTDLGILRAVVYPELWHIQNQKHILKPGTFRARAYWQLGHIQNPRLIQTSTMSNIYDEASCENS